MTKRRPVDRGARVAPAYDRPIARPRILLVCTANRCRSPMAAGILGALLAARGVDADVASAGLYDGGHPATEHAVAVLGERGVDFSGHRSRHLDDDGVDLAAADLVLGMERRHVQEAVLLDPAIRDRAFTLVDAARRAGAAAPRAPHEDLRAWAARLAAGRRPSDLLGVGDDGVADPVGQPRAAYDRTAELLEQLLRTVVDAAFPVGAGREARSA